ncbi:hypothetical protein M433DRAFT_426182 [Acidomyces richmondensis BFW]|nr:MAG: hypothetical protein FE78DRAFT_228514 [Acidomyces sp. 'richmondensis']KYG48340.1 hypothetical protein M433DRAFT_426182 [Acidomyces richmondensis BFW]
MSHAMSIENQHSDLEVLSKEILSGSVDSKLGSPYDSLDFKQTNGLRNGIDVKLDTSIANGRINGRPNGSIDSVLNGYSDTSTSMSPEVLSADPMLASALMSPLHDPLNLDAMFSPARPNLQRAPSIVHSAQSISNDWELYKRAGPRYPPSLDALIMKYHQKHNNSWQLAHDFGHGSGIYSPTLAKFFRHVHVSDPEPNGVATSRKLLGQWSAANPKKRGRFTFSATKPEDVHECCADASIDLAIITEGAHFTSAEAMVRSAATTLVKGGTLAIVTHRPIGKVVGNEKASEAVQRLFEAWGRRPWDVACSTNSKAQRQFSLGLDFVPLPEELYAREKTQRISINTYGQARQMFRIPDDEEDAPMSTDEMMDMPCSRVDEKEKRHEYSEQDEYGKGWRQEVGWESFRTRISLLDSPETVQRLEPYLKEIQEIIEKTSPNGVKVVLEWAVAVVLATRK